MTRTVYVICRGLDCDLTVRCIECTNVLEDKMFQYFAHKISLKKKLESKLKHKASSQSTSADVAPATAVVESSLAPAAVTVASAVACPISVTTNSASQVNNKEVISHFDSLFASLAQSLEARFSAIDSRFSQVMVNSASTDDNAKNVSCQDVSHPSFSAPIAPVAVRDEHPPAWAPCTPYSEGLGKSCKGLATVSSLTGVTSLPRLTFAQVIDRVRVYESSVGYVPDSYLTSLHSFVVYSDEFDVAISGDLLVDSVRSFRQHLADPVDPVPGMSQGGDNIVQFLYCLMASSGSSSQWCLGVSGDRRGGGGGFGYSRGCFLPFHLLSPPPYRFLLSLRLLPPFHPRFPFLTLVVSLHLILLLLLLRLLPLLRRLLRLRSPRLFPSALPSPVAFLLLVLLLPSLRFCLLLLLWFHFLPLLPL